MIWGEPFFWRALMAGAALAVIAAPMGCIVVWRRMAYVGETLAQAGLLGVALGLALHMDLTLAVVLAAVAAALILVGAGQQRLLAMDSVLGLMHHATLSLGIIAISVLKGPSIDLMGFLFGDVFAVSQADLVSIAVGGSLVLVATALLWKPLVRLSLDPDLAAAEGVNALATRAAFDILLALTIAVSMKIVGVLLVMAFLIVPAAGARPLARSPEMMAAIAVLIGIAGVALGLTASLLHDTPGGPSIVLAMTGLALLMLLFSKALGR